MRSCRPILLASTLLLPLLLSCAGGSDVFQAGDTVIVVTTSGQPINDLNDIFAD